MAETVVLKVGMSCEGCVGAVKRVLNKMEGVETYDVNLNEENIVVVNLQTEKPHCAELKIRLLLHKKPRKPEWVWCTACKLARDAQLYYTTNEINDGCRVQSPLRKLYTLNKPKAANLKPQISWSHNDH